MRKILMIGDAGCRTGFGRVVKGVADRLHATGNWEVVVRGINYNEDHGIDYAYDVQPVTFGGVDPMGISTLPYHIEDVKPDVIWCLQDPWHLQGYAAEKPKELPSVCYVPVDTPCIKWEAGIAMGAWSQVATYTHFGAREMTASVQQGLDVLIEGIRDRVPMDGLTRWINLPMPRARRTFNVRLDRLARIQNQEAWNVVPHGRNPGVFEPRDKAACRRGFNIPEDAFVVGFVGGNFVRKRLDTAIRAFARFAEGRPNVFLAIHCWGGDEQGWDIASLARFYGVADRLLAIHWEHKELSDDDMCSLYNCFDVMLNTSSGEGWGLPATESAECGVPQVVPDWAATRELWSEQGLLIPVTDYLHFEKYLNTAHCNLDIKAAAAHLTLLADNPEMRVEMGRRAAARAAELPTWDDIGDAFQLILSRAISEGEPTPTSLNDVLAARKDTVRSEILDRP